MKQQLLENELNAKLLRSGYDGHFRLEMANVEYSSTGPVEKCISTFFTISEASEGLQNADLSTIYPVGDSSAIIATFQLKFVGNGLVEMPSMTVQQMHGKESVTIDLSSGVLPRYKDLKNYFPPKKKWFRRFFRTLGICFLLVLFYSTQAGAQVSFKFSDLFKQNKKSLKSHATQIVELQLYLEAVKKGYRIVRSGLETIHSIRNGEFDLHNIFYTGLWKVNPEIRKLPETILILDFSQKAYRNCASLARRLRTDNTLTETERKYLLGLCNNLVADIDANVDALASILTPGKVQMDDAERTRRINTFFEVSGRQLRVSTSINGEASTLARARTKEATEMKSITNYYQQ
jgi:hypothetical protein